jgi:hypothetical protein
MSGNTGSSASLASAAASATKTSTISHPRKRGFLRGGAAKAATTASTSTLATASTTTLMTMPGDEGDSTYTTKSTGKLNKGSSIPRLIQRKHHRNLQQQPLAVAGSSLLPPASVVASGKASSKRRPNKGAPPLVTGRTCRLLRRLGALPNAASHITQTWAKRTWQLGMARPRSRRRMYSPLRAANPWARPCAVYSPGPAPAHLNPFQPSPRQMASKPDGPT